MNKKRLRGVLEIDYHLKRKTKKSLVYRLKRRTKEAIKAIEKYSQPPRKILDLGAADGLMLSKIKDKFPKSNCVGVEYSQELIDVNQDKRIKLIQGDVQKLPFKENQFNIVIATAIIEHLSSPQKFLAEIRKVIKRGGVVILTSPVPFWEKVATFMRHLPKEEHQHTFTLLRLVKMFEDKGFKILEKKRFMFSPIGFPFEEWIEKILRFFHLDFIMANQLIIARKNEK